MSFIYSQTDSWNTAGTVFAAIQMNVSNGAIPAANPVAAASSQLLNLQTNGTQNLGVRMPHVVSGSDATPFLSLADTWNTTANITGIKYNVTNTASGASSLLMDLQVGGTSQCNVSKSGTLTIAGTFTTTVGGFLAADSTVFLAATSQLTFGNDTFLTRAAAATWRLGQADAASPVAQTLQVQSVVAGTSNTAGQNFTIVGSKGTGTGTGGNIIFQLAGSGGSGSSQNAASTIMTITPGTVFVNSLEVTGGTLRVDANPTAVTHTVTIASGADSTTNFGHVMAFNFNGTTYYVPCGSVQP